MEHQGRDAAPSRLGTERNVAILAAGILAASLLFELLVLALDHRPLGDVPGRFIADGVRPGRFPYLDAHVEYPVGIGYAMWLASLAASNARQFLLSTSVLTAGAAALLVVLLQRRAPGRVTRFLLAPAVFLYAFHSWDLIAVLAAVAGVVAFEREEHGWAGALLGLGAAIKLFPAFILLPLAAALLGSRRRGTARLLAAAAAVFLALNGPVALATPSGWSYPLRFQGRRPPTWGSLWSLLFRVPGVDSLVAGDRAGAANLLAAGALVLGLLAVAALAYRREVAPAALAATAVIVFLLTNKVYSPNYDLWFVAFFPLVGWSALVRRSFNAVSVAVFVTVFGMFHGVVARSSSTDVMPLLVLVRAVLLVAAALVALQGPRRDAGARTGSGAAPQPVGGL